MVKSMAYLLLVLYGALALSLSIPLLICIIELCYSSMIAIYNLWESFVEADRIEAQRQARKQPAYTMYPLSHGWHFTATVIACLFARADATKNRWIDHVATVRYIARESFWLIQYPALYFSWLVTGGLFVAALLQYLPALFYALLFLVLHSIVCALWSVIAVVFIALLSLGSACSSWLCHVRWRCPACYKVMRQPAYVCPGCAAVHVPLCPGLCGVLFHRCKTCKTLLPTLDLLGRRHLARLCQHCHEAFPSALGRGPDHHIALVAGSAAGKTSYLVAALHAWQRLCKTDRSYQVTFADAAQEQDFAHTLLLLENGQPLPPTQEHLPRALTLKVRVSHAWLPRQVYLYDPAGTVFANSESVSQQVYYSFCNGLIFLIDPCAIPAFYHQHQAEIERAYPAMSPVPTGVVQCYERMLQALEINVGVTRKKRYPLSIAVVISKIDLLQLDKELGKSAVQALMKRDVTLSSEGEAQHRLVRAFLCAYGLDNFVRDIEAHFMHVRYFACCAQVGALESLAWTLAQTGLR
jgi:hypothetical protein